MNKKISINKLKYKLDNHEDIECYCPDCKSWTMFEDCDAPCPYWDPYCTHPGMWCSECHGKFDFMEGYKIILEYNEEMNKQDYCYE